MRDIVVPKYLPAHPLKTADAAGFYFPLRAIQFTRWVVPHNGDAAKPQNPQAHKPSGFGGVGLHPVNSPPTFPSKVLGTRWSHTSGGAVVDHTIKAQLLHVSEQVRRLRHDDEGSARYCEAYMRREALLEALFAEMHGVDQTPPGLPPEAREGFDEIAKTLARDINRE